MNARPQSLSEPEARPIPVRFLLWHCSVPALGSRVGSRFGLPSLRRGLLERKRSVAVSSVTFVVAILLLSSFAGQARAQSPGPVILLHGLSPITIGVGVSRNLSLNISGGYIDYWHPYTVIWFEGKTNSTSVQAITRHVTPNPSCTYYQNNCTYTTNTKLSLSYGWPGSYVVSVTVNGTWNDYSIGTDKLTVTDSVTLTCLTDSGPQNNNVVWVDTPILFSAYVAPGSGVTYLWDFGAGTEATGSWMQEVGTNGLDCREHVGNYHGVHDVKHTNSAPGNYVVKVTASNSFGAADREYLAPLVLSDPLACPLQLVDSSKGLQAFPDVLLGQRHRPEPARSRGQRDVSLELLRRHSLADFHVTKLSDPWGRGSPVLATTETSHTFKTNRNYTAWVEVFNQYADVTPNPTQSNGPSSAKGTISIQNPKSGPCFGIPTPDHRDIDHPDHRLLGHLPMVDGLQRHMARPGREVVRTHRLPPLLLLWQPIGPGLPQPDFGRELRSAHRHRLVHRRPPHRRRHLPDRDPDDRPLRRWRHALPVHLQSDCRHSQPRFQSRRPSDVTVWRDGRQPPGRPPVSREQLHDAGPILPHRRERDDHCQAHLHLPR